MIETKKVIVLIVEGRTDATAFAVIKKMRINEDIHFQIVNGDITSDRNSNVANIIKKVNSHIEACRKKNRFRKSDILKVIHIVDTDGAYIPEKNINYSSEDGVIYTLEGIKTYNVEGIRERNIKKSAILNKLHSTKEIANIPYSIYYMSSNLEHVLHNKQNATKDDKASLSNGIYDKYHDNPEGFSKFICESGFSVKQDYQASWEFIKQGNNSLHRHTNFNLFFEEGT